MGSSSEKYFKRDVTHQNGKCVKTEMLSFDKNVN